MQKKLVELYALLTCFVSLICIAVSIIAIANGTIQVLTPAIKMNVGKYEELQSNALFWNDYLKRKCFQEHSLQYERAVPFCERERVRPSDIELEHQRRDTMKHELELVRREGVQNLIVALIVLLVTACFFAIHWRMARSVIKVPNGNTTAA